VKAIYTNKSKIEIIRGVNIYINAGEMVAIVGPSGCGKSTLLCILGGLDKPTDGKVFFEDKDLYSMNTSDLNDFRNKNIGVVFQNHNLVEELTCYENILLPLIFEKRKISNEIINTIHKHMDMLQIRAVHNRYPYQLSGGEQQRTAIIRALIKSPKIIIADEPTGSLDKKNAMLCMEMFKLIVDKLGVAIIIATHDYSVSSICQRTLKMSDGFITS